MSTLAFYLLAAITAGGALGVVFNRNTLHAAFCLLLSLLGTAGIFVMLDAYLLAVLLVLVYAGAVVALFVFIVMLVGMQGGGSIFFSKIRVVTNVIAFFILLTGLVITFGYEVLPAPIQSDTPALGAQLKLYAYQLFTVYLLPVQVAGFMLLIAMLGVIVLAKQPKAEAGK
ncbi:MAG: NADH-quinone oxidoreductase subunit J [Opitutaceae bacterium]|jgi:NADH-quinone oxidoreductase subunit J